MLFAFGALFLKRASASGVSAWTQIFVANILASLLFSGFIGLGGTWPGVAFLWQPALIGVLYIIGQTFILTAVRVGDVSVATPVASLKVVVVAVFLTVIAGSTPSVTIWVAAMLAAAGVFLINYFVPKVHRSNVVLTAILAFSAASTFALFDVCVQMFTDYWGTGYLASISYWFVGLFSLALIPLCDKPGVVLAEKNWKSLLFGCFLVALQASFLVYAVSRFGDAASVNVVYSLRGLWGVIFAWWFASYFSGNESSTPRRTMVLRLIGASLLVTAVVITVIGQTQ